MNVPPAAEVEGFSDSLIGWIPEESRIGPIPVERSKLGLILAAIIAAVIVGGGGITAAVMMGGDDGPKVATKSEPEAPPTMEREPPVVAAIDTLPPQSDHEPDLVLDEDDLVLDEDDERLLAEELKKNRLRSKKPGGRKAVSPSGSSEPVPAGPVVELSARMVRREIASNMYHVHRCYDAALRTIPSLQGRYSITITITIGGKISRVEIDKDTLGHAGVASCVKRKIRSWRFPLDGRLAEPTEVSFPVTFKR